MTDLQVLGLTAAVAIVVQWIAFVPAWIRRTEKFYDLVGSVTYLVVIGLCMAVSLERGSASTVSWLAALAVVVWAVRLGGYLALRVHQVGHDRRFTELKQSFPRFLVAWTVQGVWVFLTSLAAQLLILKGPALSVGTALGGSLWVLGFGIEVLADHQKRVFREDPANQERWIDTGLWAWSRHPNYFGEIVLWVGMFVAGTEVWQGASWLTVLSPAFVILLLTRVSGIPLLEASAERRWGADPAYQAYRDRTPPLVLRPPQTPSLPRD